MTKHLWEYDHPYYATEGNYFKNGYHEPYDSWAQFFEEQGSLDPDLNLVYRWDWHGPDPSNPDNFYEDHSLYIYWMSQRKAICRSSSIKVTPEDEPAVRAWLAERVETIKAIWEPLL